MPRGDNPNSRKNLKPLNKLTKEEQREVQRKGTAASIAARRSYRDIRESLKELITPEKSTQLADTLLKKALDGNINAYKVLLPMLGADISDAKSRLEALQAEKLEKEISGEISDTHITVKFESADGGADSLSV